MKYIVAFIFILSGLPLLGADLAGIVIDEESESPIDNVIISVEKTSIKIVTDEDGKFEIKSIEPGEYFLQFRRIGYISQRRIVRISESEKASPFVLKMTPKGVTTARVVVKGNNTASKFMELSQHANKLDGKDLQKQIGISIAATLKNEAGIAVRSMGPAPARPVIRGLGGNRIMLSQDNEPVSDMSASSPDHAVTVEPSGAEKIEVIRGPKVLLSTNSTIGGVVNVVKNDIPQEKLSENTFIANTSYESANNSKLAYLKAIIPVSDFVLKGSYSHRNAGDMHSPLGVLENTELKTSSYNFGAAYLMPDFSAGASVSEFSSNYGIPGGFVGAHPKGVDIEMLKRKYAAKLTLDIHREFIDNFSLDLVRNYYKHTEYESNGAIGAEFVFRDFSLDLKANQKNYGIFDFGTMGLFFNYRDLKLGGFVFTPPTSNTSFAPYFFEDFNLGEYMFQFAFRYGYDNFTPDQSYAATSFPVRSRTFHSVSASVSMLKETFKNIFFGANLSRTSRAPSIEELYSQGPHLAAYSYETGNPDLEGEYGYGSELFAYWQSDLVFASITGFYNYLPYFISSSNTGKINYSQLLPIYQSKGVEAELYGIEAKLDHKICKCIRFIANLSYTIGNNKSENMPLPQIPPFKSFLELQYLNNEFELGINAEYADSQERVDKFELATSSYFITGIYGRYSFMALTAYNTVSFRIDNIFDREYYNHLSRIRKIMPERGINLKLQYELYLQ